MKKKKEKGRRVGGKRKKRAKNNKNVPHSWHYGRKQTYPRTEMMSVIMLFSCMYSNKLNTEKRNRTGENSRWCFKTSCFCSKLRHPWNGQRIFIRAHPHPEVLWSHTPGNSHDDRKKEMLFKSVPSSSFIDREHNWLDKDYLFRLSTKWQKNNKKTLLCLSLSVAKSPTKWPQQSKYHVAYSRLMQVMSIMTVVQSGSFLLTTRALRTPTTAPGYKEEREGQTEYSSCTWGWIVYWEMLGRGLGVVWSTRGVIKAEETEKGSVFSAKSNRERGSRWLLKYICTYRCIYLYKDICVCICIDR